MYIILSGECSVMLTCMPWNFLDRCDATKIVVLWKLLNVPESFVNIYIYIYILWEEKRT